MKSAVGDTLGFKERIFVCGTPVRVEIASMVSPARTTYVRCTWTGAGLNAARWLAGLGEEAW